MYYRVYSNIIIEYNFLSFPDFSGNYLHLDAGSHTQRKKARLLSPEVGPERGPLCLLFYYQLQGEAQGSLRVLLRDSDQEETLLWVLKGDQGTHWKEGRTILPQSPKEYQVGHLFQQKQNEHEHYTNEEART